MKKILACSLLLTVIVTIIAYLTSTPYEETRGFDFLGLTYANSKDVTIEIKVSKRGYMNQAKRFNARQTLDQQEISGFFKLVPSD